MAEAACRHILALLYCLSFISGCLGLGRAGPAVVYSRYSMSSPPDRAAIEPDFLEDVA